MSWLFQSHVWFCNIRLKLAVKSIVISFVSLEQMNRLDDDVARALWQTTEMA